MKIIKVVAESLLLIIIAGVIACLTTMVLGLIIYLSIGVLDYLFFTDPLNILNN